MTTLSKPRYTFVTLILTKSIAEVPETVSRCTCERDRGYGGMKRKKNMHRERKQRRRLPLPLPANPSPREHPNNLSLSRPPIPIFHQYLLSHTHTHTHTHTRSLPPNPHLDFQVGADGFGELPDRVSRLHHVLCRSIQSRGRDLLGRGQRRGRMGEESKQAGRGDAGGWLFFPKFELLSHRMPPHICHVGQPTSKDHLRTS
jgi:hypothetical protein